MKTKTKSHAAFTLIELLVVVAVIAILISVLLPALQGARAAAQKIVGANIQRQLSTAMFTYATDNDGEIAGLGSTQNTEMMREIRYSTNGLRKYVGDTRPTTPTSTHDWISPIIGEELNFSRNRAERTGDIFNTLACPTASRINDDTNGSSLDFADFRRLLFDQGITFTQISFLAPLYHSLYGSERGVTSANFRQIDVFSQPREYGQTRAQATIPEGYRPRLDKVDNAVNKAMIADGNRYLTGSGVLNFDVNPDPQSYGSFYTSGPIFDGSTSYGRSAFNANSGGDQLPLSIRHNGGTAINVTMFDGSGSTITTNSLWADPTPWYPSGSTFEGGRNTTQEALDFTADWTNAEGDIIIP